MQFLKTLFWVVMAAIAVIFATRNWTPVTINLWGGLAADIKLPILLLFAFIIGFVPSFLMHKAARWHYRRRLDTAQRTIDEMQAQLASPRLDMPGQAEPELPPPAPRVTRQPASTGPAPEGPQSTLL